MFDTRSDTMDQRRTAEKYFGKYPGLVKDNEPIEAEHRGELVVEVPGILEETPDGMGQQSIQLIAKPCFLPGFFYIPEIGDKVWVEFVAGDINSPLWTGVWYPENGTPQTTDDEAPTRFQKIIRTISGHVIQLDDSDGAEKVEIAHKSGANLKMDEKGSVLIADQNSTFIFMNADKQEVTVLDQHKNLITLKDAGIVLANKEGGFIEVNNEGKMKLASKQAVQISASEIILDSLSIGLGGSSALASSVLLADLILPLLDTHVHSHPMGPTGPPLVPLTPMKMTITSQSIKAAP